MIKEVAGIGAAGDLIYQVAFDFQLPQKIPHFRGNRFQAAGNFAVPIEQDGFVQPFGALGGGVVQKVLGVYQPTQQFSVGINLQKRLQRMFGAVGSFQLQQGSGIAAVGQ